jgi:hypothetical protein
MLLVPCSSKTSIYINIKVETGETLQLGVTSKEGV